MPNTKISIPNLLKVCESLSNQEFLRYYMEMKNPDNIFCLKRTYIERFGDKFLKYVMNGNQEATQAMMSQCPEIVSYRVGMQLQDGTVTHVAASELIGENTAMLDIFLNARYEDMTPEDIRKTFHNALLYHTIRGNQEAVVKILHRYPTLLAYRGDVVDYSGREFKQVTALELATWALDVRHMAPAMLKCLTDNEEGKDYRKELAPELQSQFDNVVKEGGGVNYTIGCGLLKMSEDPRTLLPGKSDEERYAELNRRLNRHDGLIQFEDKLFYFHNLKFPKKLVEITDVDTVNALKGLMNKEERKLEVDTLQIINNDDELKMIQKIVPDSRHIFREKHYDFTPLLNALDVYVHCFDDGNTWSWGQRDAHWCTVVGLAQHYAASHVAQHYCNPDESFDPQNNKTPPTFKEKDLRRVLSFYDWTGKAKRWWGGPVAVPLLNSGSGPGLGGDYGISRSSCPRARAPVDYDGDRRSRVDLAALTALCKVRTDEARDLKQLLDSLQKPENGSELARCAVQ